MTLVDDDVGVVVQVVAGAAPGVVELVDAGVVAVQVVVGVLGGGGGATFVGTA